MSERISTDTLNRSLTHRKRMAYIPFKGGVGGPRVAVKPLPQDKPWLEFDEDKEIQLYLKSRLLDTVPDCCIQTERRDVTEEAAQTVAEWLESEHDEYIPYWAKNKLFEVSRKVQDDLCVLDPAGVFIAGSVCFPTGWTLPEMIGKKPMEVHSEISTEKFQRAVEKKLSEIGEEPVWRTNCFLYADPYLRHDFPNRLFSKQNAPYVTSQNAGHELFLRYERQTLRRLPQTGGLIFTIRVYVDPLSTLKLEHPEYVEDFFETSKKYHTKGPWTKPMTEYLLS